MTCEQCEENYKNDGIEPDCENCGLPVLSPENREILELYETINTEFVRDFNALEMVIEIHGIARTREDAKDLLKRLILIHWIRKDHERQSLHNS